MGKAKVSDPIYEADQASRFSGGRTPYEVRSRWDKHVCCAIVADGMELHTCGKIATKVLEDSSGKRRQHAVCDEHYAFALDAMLDPKRYYQREFQEVKAVAKIQGVKAAAKKSRKKGKSSISLTVREKTMLASVLDRTLQQATLTGRELALVHKVMGQLS